MGQGIVFETHQEDVKGKHAKTHSSAKECQEKLQERKRIQNDFLSPGLWVVAVVPCLLLPSLPTVSLFSSSIDIQRICSPPACCSLRPSFQSSGAELYTVAVTFIFISLTLPVYFISLHLWIPNSGAPPCFTLFLQMFGSTRYPAATFQLCVSPPSARCYLRVAVLLCPALIFEFDDVLMSSPVCWVPTFIILGFLGFYIFVTGS